MQTINILIYILACTGLLFTMISMIESYNYRFNEIKYECENEYVKKVEIIIKVRGCNNEECEKIIEKIKKGSYNNIEEIVDNVKIKKYI